MPLIFFYCEPIFDVIRISNSCVYQKTLPAIFEKKRLSLSLLIYKFNTKYSSRLDILSDKEAVLTLERRLFATPGAPGAGQRGHFRLSTWILRDTEVIATNDFFQKEGAPFSDR